MDKNVYFDKKENIGLKRRIEHDQGKIKNIKKLGST